MMNFWVLSPNAQNDGNLPYWLARTKKEGKVFIGYGEDKKHGNTFANTIAEGDCIIVAHGSGDKRKLYYAGLVKSDRQFDDNDEIFFRKFDLLVDEMDFTTNSIVIDSSNAWGESSNPGTIYQLKSSTIADKVVMDKLTELFKTKIMAKSLQEKIDILKFKKQIILQGPPGTGKTYTAKQIAAEMTKGKNIGSPKQKIDDYFKSNLVATDDAKDKRSEYSQLLNEFQNKFRKEELKNLSLEAYAFGRGDNDSFCYWLEYVLWDLGLYSGQAGKFKIYWKKSIDGYSKIGFLKDIEDDEEAMRILAEQIYNVANEINLNEAAKKLSNGLVLKILHSYHPQKYFPINNQNCINNALKLLNVDGTSLDLISKNLKLQELFQKKKSEFGSDITNDEFMRFLFANFDMQGSIAIQSNEVVLKGESKIIQFHPAYSYEDFVRGISAIASGENKIEYKVENRILVEFAQNAIDNPSANYILIIDEINRANLPSVLGELIYALEYRYDEADPKNTTVDSMYAIKLDDETESKEIKVPKNLYIIGTMNTADRSVGHIDYAIRRRFAFVDVLPNEIPELTYNGKNLFRKVALLFCEKFEEGKSDLKSSKYLAQDFKPTDVILGHSYFLIKEEDRKTLGKTDDEILEMKLTYEILPLLREYVKDGILSKDAELQFKPTIEEWLKP